MSSHIFAGNAPAMQRQRLAVLPVGVDRQPYISGFGKWKARPGARRVEEWSERFSDANIAVLPALSGRNGATVLDCDSQEAVAKAEDRFGKTPLQTITSDGRHLWYAATDAELPGNLRAYGLAIDIKRGKGEFVIAPPSQHGTGHIYRLDDAADWSALDRLPALKLDALDALMTGNSGNGFQNSELELFGNGRPAETEQIRVVTKGQRTVTLNKMLVRAAFDCGDFDTMLDLAHAYNAEFAPPMTPERVVKCAAKVWRSKAEGRIEPMKGKTSMEKRSRHDIRVLCELDPKHGSDAFTLWQVLQDEHSARCRRGEAFQITPKAMAAAQVIPGWKRERYEAARDLLLRARFLRRVQSFRSNAADGRRPALFQLQMLGSLKGGAGGGSIRELH